MEKYVLRPDSIRKLFDTVAPSYDFLNRLLSLRRDVTWRREAVGELRGTTGWILDLATGTGDVALEVIRQANGDRRVMGIDFSEAMIRGANRKVLRRRLSGTICLGLGDGVTLPFRDSTFSACIIAFGLRNILEKERALSEMVRVTRTHGKVIVLEFTLPQKGLMKALLPHLLYEDPSSLGWMDLQRSWSLCLSSRVCAAVRSRRELRRAHETIWVDSGDLPAPDLWRCLCDGWGKRFVMIRHFTISDLHPLLDIEHQAFPKSPYDWTTFLNLQWIYPQSFLVYVEGESTEREEQLWGYVVFSLDGHIISLAVHPEKRRKGIGRRLLRSVTHYPQIKKIWAEVRVSNQGAQMFYQWMGFETIGRLPNYYGDEDALIIQRFLPFDDLH